MALLCSLIGHRWQISWQVVKGIVDDTTLDDAMFTWCTRCGTLAP